MGSGPNEGNSEERERLFEVPGEKILMVEEWWSYVLKRDCVWVMHTLGKEFCISTQGWQVVKTRRGIKSMIDLVLVKKDMLRYVQDARAVRGMR